MVDYDVICRNEALEAISGGSFDCSTLHDKDTGIDKREFSSIIEEIQHSDDGPYIRTDMEAFEVCKDIDMPNVDTDFSGFENAFECLQHEADLKLSRAFDNHLESIKDKIFEAMQETVSYLAEKETESVVSSLSFSKKVFDSEPDFCNGEEGIFVREWEKEMTMVISFYNKLFITVTYKTEE